MQLKRLTIAAALVALGAPALAANPTDNVLSANVKEADGTSGQNTDAGSGIKTNHLQNGAVTAAKLAPGAVTDAAIAGPISASKISSQGLDADTVDGQHASAFAKKYAKVVVVSTDGRGDFTDPIAAMDSIVDASATNPYLLKVMPGVYAIPYNTLRTKSYVDIEGSGAGVTKITVSCPIYMCVAAIAGGVVAEYRDITFEGIDAGDRPIALWVALGGDLRLTRVALDCTQINGRGTECLQVSNGNVTLQDSVVRAGDPANTNPGYVYNVHPIFLQDAAKVTMRGGSIVAPAGVAGHGPVGTFRGSGVEFVGPPVAPNHWVPQTMKCVSCFDGNYDPVAMPTPTP